MPVDYSEAQLKRLERSAFRRRFRLSERDRAYARSKSPAVLRKHAVEFLKKRVASARPLKDGKQTPFRGHPVFTAQHATGTCCRGCLQKWYGFQKGRPLDEKEINTLVDVIMLWIERQTI